jgi:hypothetical protein
LKIGYFIIRQRENDQQTLKGVGLAWSSLLSVQFCKKDVYEANTFISSDFRLILQLYIAVKESLYRLCGATRGVEFKVGDENLKKGFSYNGGKGVDERRNPFSFSGTQEERGDSFLLRRKSRSGPPKRRSKGNRPALPEPPRTLPPSLPS